MDSENDASCQVQSLLPVTFTYYYLSFYLSLLLFFSLWAAHELVDLRSLTGRIRTRIHHFKRGRANEDVAKINEILHTHGPVAIGEAPQTPDDADMNVTTSGADSVPPNTTEDINASGHDPETKKSMKKFASKWWKSIQHFKSCYFMTLNHIFDQVTDFAVVIEFIQLYQLERKYKESNSGDYCKGVNTGLLALWSIFALLLYRIVSAVSIFRLTKDWKRIFLQFFDFELFRTMYVNYINNSINPCNPQRWIQSLESFLESTPQALIQLYFVIKSSVHGRNVSNIVYVSTLWSIWMIANRSVSEDKLAFKHEYQNASINSWKFEIISRYFCIKKGYLGRLLYRLMDVFYRLCVVLLVWLFMGGFAIGVVLFVESVIIVYLCYKTNEFSEYIYMCIYDT